MTLHDGDRLAGALRWAAGLLALASVVFHLWLVFSGLVPNLISRPVHLALALPWVFLLVPYRTALGRGAGVLFCLAGVAACAWVALNRAELEDQYGSLEGGFQVAVALLLLAVVLEMARRAVKMALPAAALVALAYGLLGQHLPGRMGHPGIPLESFLGTLTIAEGGIWGPLTGISVNIVAVFVIFGAAIGAGLGGEAFMALATRLAGRLEAGAAKVSVLASALFGSISGSASANVASTGAITLPAMKRLGYPASLAAAVEATASTGGQIMPPLMGAGAFVMAELLRTRYTAIVEAALFPALLFFVAVWFGIALFARRYGLKPMAAEEIPAWRRVGRLSPFFLIPFGVLLWAMFAAGRTPQYAAALATFAALALMLLDDRWRPALGRLLPRLSEAAVAAARQIAVIASIIICAGIVVGVLNQTGLGVKITSAILTLSDGSLYPALLLTALACLILGMEVPTTAAYVICVSVAGPALQKLGLPPLQAHLFVFWYALLSTITPPVCGTVFIAAGMAEAPWLKVAGQAMRLGLGLYVVPLAFIASPSLLDPLGQPAWAILAFLKTALGLWLLARALVRAEDPWWLRLASALIAVALAFLPTRGVLGMAF
ncbi:MAG: TRAP transporter fused permease subunit [Tistlia sp.]|uniref:TRAP transporter permease n=1 Tax=Tistlia sp. TaxID=3057121 RepID=UPI0034A43D08